jgi:ribonuclease BN (tRNA processing enzyme)
MESYGYRFDAPDPSVVISADTNPTEETIKTCSGCDVLVHEGRAQELFNTLPDAFRSFVAKYHTTSEQLAVLATEEAKPGLLVVYHSSISWWPSSSSLPPSR